MNEGIRTLVKDLRETSFRIQDVIDEYIIYVSLMLLDVQLCSVRLSTSFKL